MRKKQSIPPVEQRRLVRLTVWEDGGIQHPCGHESSFDDGCLKMDHFRCPTCGQRWHMEQAQPTVHESGWAQPGNRKCVIEPQMELLLNAS